MKPGSPELDALLASRQFYKVELFTIVLVDGITTLRYCSGDMDVAYGGNVFSAGGQVGPYFVVQTGNTGRSHQSTGLTVDAMVIDVVPGASTLLGLPFEVACRYGVLDGATLRREVAIMPTYGDTSPGTILMFFGRIAEIDINDLVLTININAPTELLNQQYPRNIFLAGCVNTLGDASCTVDQTVLKVDGVAVTASKTQVLFANAQVSGYFTQGKIIFSSGSANGLSRSIKAHAQGATLTMWPPLPTAPSPGDTFSVFPGCDKSTGPNGCPKFNNLPNFRGFPQVPVAETSV